MICVVILCTKLFNGDKLKALCFIYKCLAKKKQIENIHYWFDYNLKHDKN